ncbi:hypothetical protein SRIMM317S_03845 [Streptomyces rimosus subsp. rimosus]
MPAEFEEFVVHVHLRDAEDFREEAAQQFFPGGARRPSGTVRLPLRQRQRRPVEGAVGGQRQPVEQHHGGRDEVFDSRSAR